MFRKISSDIRRRGTTPRAYPPSSVNNAAAKIPPVALISSSPAAQTQARQRILKIADTRRIRLSVQPYRKLLKTIISYFTDDIALQMGGLFRDFQTFFSRSHLKSPPDSELEAKFLSKSEGRKVGITH